MIVATLPHTFPPQSAVLGWGRSLGIWSVSGTCAKQSTNAHRCDAGRPEVPAGSWWLPPERTGTVGLLLSRNGQRRPAPLCLEQGRGRVRGGGSSVAGHGALCRAGLVSPVSAVCPCLAALTPPCRGGC